MLLPRSDAVISFAGATNDAFPLMLQVYNAINIYIPARDRTLDLPELKGHLIRVINKAREEITHLPNGHTGPVLHEASFMLSGYSWRKKEFKVWTLHYDSHIDKFTFRPMTSWRGQEGLSKQIAFVGD